LPVSCIIRRTRLTSALSARSTIGPWPPGMKTASQDRISSSPRSPRQRGSCRPGIAARASAARLALAWLSRYTSSRICMIRSADSRLAPRRFHPGVQQGQVRSPDCHQVQLAEVLVFRTGRPARIDDYSDASEQAIDIARKAAVRSAVGVPITVGGRLWHRRGNVRLQGAGRGRGEAGRIHRSARYRDHQRTGTSRTGRFPGADCGRRRYRPPPDQAQICMTAPSSGRSLSACS
jgi:hypothetical protein